MLNQIFVALGSNIDKERNLPAAVRVLHELTNVVALSQVYETVSVGLLEQPNFFNAAVLIHSKLDLRAFRREVLREVERRLERVRTVDKSAPRTIDADIILFNSTVLDYSDGRHIPDPNLRTLAHVAVPIAELSPTMRHPETKEPLTKIAERLLSLAQQQSPPTIWLRSDIHLPLNVNLS